MKNMAGIKSLLLTSIHRYPVTRLRHLITKRKKINSVIGVKQHIVNEYEKVHVAEWVGDRGLGIFK